ncbi:caspase family protein [Rhabdochromatium marinum]|uniref:caspase family protein n=1 Tax=Rhabdochromatium marinum TaxID=48729 RepID=UPI0019031123|nr:caspase family protein [Rhabdochromatium marinum]MBK1648805.1 hypothetical protein [Rhabdochromatium marinum]
MNLPSLASRRGGMFALILVALSQSALATLSTDPLLRIETGMHTASIRALEVDRSAGLFFTASDDKTIRAWNLVDGRLVDIFRVPAGAGDEGRLYALAASPDGRWLAAGGMTQAVTEGRGNYHIYLFDRASKGLTSFIASLPDVVNHLCVSDDGAYLAATLGSDGVRVWSTENWRLIAIDQAYQGASHGCDFSPGGQLVTTSLDGYVRLYKNASFGLLEKSRLSVGDEPFGAAFSPAGDRIAIGFADTPRVSLVSTQDLSELLPPNTRGLTKGGLSQVAWSQDGRRLFAAGRYQTEGQFPIIAWADAGAGRRELWKGTANIVTDLQALPDGGLLVSTDYPAWLKLSASGNHLDRRQGAVPDFRDKLGNALRISADGRRVAVGLGYSAQDMVLLDLKERRLFEGNLNETWLLQRKLQSLGYDPGPFDGQYGRATAGALSAWRSDAGLGPGGLNEQVRARLELSPLTPARTTAAGMTVKHWKQATEPALNGQPLPLDPYERSQAFAIAPHGQGFVLGTSWYLRAFYQSGEPRWSIPVPDAAWGINISADGKVLVAALGDGTLRWYRYADGVELLAVYINKRSHEWVAWTPKGYYDASPGGDRLIGWQLNRYDELPGLAIQYVVPGSSADLSGLRAGDVIQAINDKPINSRADLVALLQTASAGDSLNFLVLREGASEDVDVLLAAVQPGGPPRLGAVVGKALSSVQASDFFPVNVFRERFYRPKVVEMVLQTLDESDAIAASNVRGSRSVADVKVSDSLPPIVDILSPEDGDNFDGEQVTVRYLIRNPGGEQARKVQILVDGRPLDSARGLKRITGTPDAKSSTDETDDSKGQQSMTIKLPARDVSVTVVAENQFGASPPSTVKLHWAGEKLAESRDNPTLYVLSIGVSEYEDNRLDDLNYAAKDAQDFAQVIKQQHNGLYKDVIVEVLSNPNRETFLDGLDWLNKKVTEEDVAMLFVAGHGVNDEDGDYYFLVSDANPERIARTAVPQYDIRKSLATLPGKVIAFFDTCHSGSLMTGVADINGVVNDLTAAENGIVVYSSSSGNQASLENPMWENGAFTEVLVNGLNGDADLANDGKITIKGLDFFLSNQVSKLTENQQTPVTKMPSTISDFAIAIKPEDSSRAQLSQILKQSMRRANDPRFAAENQPHIL